MQNYKTLCEEAYEANMEIQKQNLAIYTWGNCSAYDADKGVFAIKPSGVEYNDLSPDKMVVIDLDGKIAEGKLKPSSDTKTHLVLYKNFSPGGITHTHSPYAVAWAQAKMNVPVFGTTHADNCPNEIPCTEYLSKEAVGNDYETETGSLIAETFKNRKIDPSYVNMVLVAGHGPFTWGSTSGKSGAMQSVINSVILEEICKMAFLTLTINPNSCALPEYIVKKHWDRKHGKDAYYGQ